MTAFGLSVLPVPSKCFGVFSTAPDEKVRWNPQNQSGDTSARSWGRPGDLGACLGTPRNHAFEPTRRRLPGEFEILQSPGLRHHTFHVIEGDACSVEQFGDRSFDLVFSNSVIEHVGPPAKQAEFAHEVLRLGRSYWVQTPSKWFPPSMRIQGCLSTGSTRNGCERQ